MSKPEALPLTLVESGPHDPEGTGPTVEVGHRSTLRLTFEIERAGFPSAAVTIETSEDGGEPWRPLGVVRPSPDGRPIAIQGFRAAVNRGSWAIRECFVGADRFVRARWEFPWHDRASFSIAGEAV